MPYGKLIHPAPGQAPYAMLLIADDNLLSNPALPANGWSAGVDEITENHAIVRITLEQRLQVLVGDQLVFDEVNSAGPPEMNWLKATEARGLCMVIVTSSSTDTTSPATIGAALIDAMDGKIDSLWASGPVEV